MLHCYDESCRQSLFMSRSRLSLSSLDCVYLHSPPTTLNDIQIDSIRKVINEEISDCRVKIRVSLKFQVII